jgi:GNAT superfamily N-acetyltransferase
MKPQAELVSASNLNYLGSFRKLVEHSGNGELRDIGPVTAFVTGVPVSLFNGCLIMEPTTPAELEAALRWVAAFGLPYRVWMEEARARDLAEAAQALGLDRDPWLEPGMVLHPIPDAPARPPGVTIVPVNNEAGLGEHLGILIEGGMPADSVHALFPPSFAADPNVRLFTARLDGRPVGTSVAVRTGDVAGVYGVGTLPVARRRGIGSAASWAAVAEGRAWGCDTIALQSTEIGFHVYRSMGFRTVVRYASFRPAFPMGQT